MKFTTYDDGLLIEGTFPEPEVVALIESYLADYGKLPLVIIDPPYGNILSDKWDRVGNDDKQFAGWMFEWTNVLATLMLDNAALYVWGGVGKPKEGKKKAFRPFFRYLADVENETPFEIANYITWGKKRAYGVQTNYLFTREELAYLTLGTYNKPRMFNVPLLDVKRGYAGYNEDYPAKSEFLRRNNVWTDITEIMRGKLYDAQKPLRVMEIPIEVHTEVGDFVLDPMAGSGTTAEAARKLGRRFILVENDPKALEIIKKRLA